MRAAVRERCDISGGYISLEETIRIIVAKAPNFIDLDEFLENFSIKGPITNILRHSRHDTKS